ncbi:TPA: hypothetical protein EYP66_00245 [Candidatus Poribacteria bacterium]|nr:hypothetical protein [Candidatus Poribacteria bacterium]
MSLSIAGPVFGDALFDREEEVEDICKCVETVKTPQKRCFYTLQGVRKIGKTSIIHEVKRRYAAHPDICVVIIDCYDRCDDADLFHIYWATSVMNEFLTKKGYAKQTGTFSDPKKEPKFSETFPEIAGKIRSLGIEALESGLLAVEWLLQLPEGKRRPYGGVTGLAEDLADEGDVYFQMIFDEFQETALLREQEKVRNAIGDIFRFWRSQWVNIHRRVNYIVTGSRLAQLRYILENPRQAFFGHFSLIGIVGLVRPEAKRMIETLLSEEGYILQSKELLDQLLDLTDGQPYCIREVLDAACRRAGRRRVVKPEDIKWGIQDSFFGEHGRLRIHFEEYFQDCVETYPPGREVLISISQKNRTAEEIAEDLRIPISGINHHLERLERFYIIRNVNINRYIYADKVLEFWVCGAKSPCKRVAGPYLVGTEVERQLASFLLEHGIDLVYQSFQSRGAFDLLMEFDHTSIAIQVKKVKRFYYHFKRASYNRMVDYVEKFGRRWGVVCLYNDEEFRFYKLQNLNQTKHGYSITKKTPYTKNPLALL